MPAQPGADRLALVPRGIIPDQEQGSERLRCQALTAPGQEINGHSAHRTAVNKPQQHLVSRRRGGAHQHPITRQGLRVGVLLGTLQFLKPGDATRRAPAMLIGLGQAAPPDLIGKAQCPGGLGTGQAHQAVAAFFFGRTPGRGW